MTKRLYPFEDHISLQHYKLHVSQKEVDMGVASDWLMPQVYDKTKSLLFHGRTVIRRNGNDFDDGLPSKNPPTACSQLKSKKDFTACSNIRQSHFNAFGQLCRNDQNKGLPSYDNVAKSEPSTWTSCPSCATANPIMCTQCCYFCDKFICNNCASKCNRCQDTFCSLCSLKIYDQKEEQAVCLSCS